MIFVNIGHELYRVVTAYNLHHRLHAVLVGRDGRIHADRLSSDNNAEWRFHTGCTAKFMTLIFGGEYPCPTIPNQYCPLPREQSAVHYPWSDGKIAEAIPRSLMGDE